MRPPVVEVGLRSLASRVVKLTKLDLHGARLKGRSQYNVRRVPP